MKRIDKGHGDRVHRHRNPYAAMPSCCCLSGTSVLGPKADLTPPMSDFPSAPNNAHQHAGRVGRFRAPAADLSSNAYSSPNRLVNAATDVQASSCLAISRA
jgi:hypothetical protein